MHFKFFNNFYSETVARGCVGLGVAFKKLFIHLWSETPTLIAYKKRRQRIFKQSSKIQLQ